MSDGDETVNKIVSTVGLWWPDAEEGDIRRAAEAWETFAGAMEHAGQGAQGGANQALAHWQGDAADGFRAHSTDVAHAVTPTADGARRMASALREFADEVEHAKHQVEELAIEIGASIAIGTAMAFFTFGASEAAAGGISASLIAAAARIGVQLTARAAAIGGRIAVGAVFGSVSAMGGNAVSQVARVEGFHEGGYSLPELGQATAMGAGGGAVLEGATGVLGRLGRWGRGRTPGAGAESPSLGGTGPGGSVRSAPFRDRQGMLTDGRYRVSAGKQARHDPATAPPGKSTFAPGTDTEQLALDAARRADEDGLWTSSNPNHPSGDFANKAKVVYNDPIGTHGRTGSPTTVVNVYRTAKGTIHISPGSPP